MLKGKKVFAIIGAAGAGQRMGAPLPKQFLKIDGKTILETTVEKFLQASFIDGLVLVTSADYMEYCRNLFDKQLKGGRLFLTEGGSQRQDSMYQGILFLREQGACDQDLLLIHDGVRPYVTPDLILRVAESAEKTGAVIPAVPPKDTMVHDDLGTLDRSKLHCVQTPQGFAFGIMEEAMEAAMAEGFYGTDDAGLVERLGKSVAVIDGERTNIKITTPEDLPVETRIGTGFDVHRLEDNRKLILGGVEIPFEKGLLGHSDADVLVHALMDALLGAAALGDIGKLFPDSDPAYSGISSILLLEKVGQTLAEAGYTLGNADVTVICQRPKLAPFVQTMRENIAKALGAPVDSISVKATTTEKLGFTGRGEGIAAEAVCLLHRNMAI